LCSGTLHYSRIWCLFHLERQKSKHDDLMSQLYCIGGVKPYYHMVADILRSLNVLGFKVFVGVIHRTGMYPGWPNQTLSIMFNELPNCKTTQTQATGKNSTT
jgi:hypothetical protein